MDRPPLSGVIAAAVEARLNADPVVVALVSALTGFVQIVDPFVRAGKSATVMCSAYDDAVAAIHAAAMSARERS